MTIVLKCPAMSRVRGKNHLTAIERHAGESHAASGEPRHVFTDAENNFFASTFPRWADGCQLLKLSVPIVPEVRMGRDWASAEELKLTASSAR